MVCWHLDFEVSLNHSEEAFVLEKVSSEMENDELDRHFESPCPIAIASEPIWCVNPPVVRKEELAEPPIVSGEEWIGNTAWCVCGCCTVMPTTQESLCCQEASLDHVVHGHLCITMVPRFNTLCLEVDVLEVAMLSLKDMWVETLVQPVNSR